MGDYFVIYGLLFVPVCLLGMRALLGNPRPRVSSSRSARRVGRSCFDDATDSCTHNSDPFVNVDGTPMMGDVDIHGNPYGVTSYGFGHDSMFSDDSSSLFDDD